MKLKRHIATYIRSCGYAAALTLAAGSLHAETGTSIDFLTHEGGMPAEVAGQTEYELGMDVSRPDMTGVTPWGTGEDCNNIIDAVNNGEAAITNWTPWRPLYGHAYENFAPNLSEGERYTNAVTHDSTSYFCNAIRPTIQASLNGSKGYNRSVEEISYLGARSLLPSWEQASSFSYYTEDDIINGIFTETGKLVARTKFIAVYGENNQQITDEQGRKLYTDRTANQYYKKVYANDDDYEGTLEALPNHIDEIRSWNSGDNTLGFGRTEVAATTTPVNVFNNKLVIERSGFALGVGAYSQFGNVYNNYTYIQDVRVSDDIYCASVFKGDAYDNTLVIVRAQAIGMNTTLADEQAGVTASNYNSSGSVASVMNGSGDETCRAWNNKLFIYGSSVYQFVAGGYTGGDAIDNMVFISRSNITTGLDGALPSRGGYSTRTGNAANNMLIIDDTFDADAAGVEPEVRDDSVAGGWTASVPDVTTMHEDIQGGATSRAYGDKGAHNNKVIVLGITTPSTDAAKEGKLVTTTIQGNVFGGVVLNNSHNGADVDWTLSAASATGNTVLLSGVNVENSSIVPMLRSRSPEENVWGDKYVSTDVGRICGGYVGAPKDGRAPGNANDNTVILMDTKVSNSVYGGSNEGAGEASGNELHLSHVDTTGKDGATCQSRTFYGGWIDAYGDGGHANNNNVWLYDSGWSMDKTFLYGGNGNELAHAANGDILGVDGTSFIKGAKSFDGTHFLAADGTALATVELSKLVKGDSSSVSGIFSNVTAFDGANFYDGDRNSTGTFESLSIMNPTNSKDIMSAATDIRVRDDGGVDFITDDASGSVIATYYKEGEHAGRIIGADGKEFASGIDHYDTATESFVNADGAEVVRVARGTIVDSGSNIKAYGITSYDFDDKSGDLVFRDKDGNTVATFVSSTIKGADEDGTPVYFDIKDSEVDKNGIHMVKRGEVSQLFAKIDGYNEYDTYTRGNWLHVAGYQGKLRGFDHFEKLSFLITADTDLTKPLVTITGPKDEIGLSFVNADGETTPVSVEVNLDAIADDLKPGDIIPIIGQENHDEIASMDEIPEEVVDDSKKHRAGTFRTVQIDTRFKEMDGGEFDNFGVVEVIGRKDVATPEAKALVEGRIATLSLNNTAGNLVAEQGIDSAARLFDNPEDRNAYVAVGQDGKGTYIPKDELEPGKRLFFAMSGGHTNVDSGSHVNVDGVNALVGIAQGLLKQDTLVLGAFMETGWGQYTTHSYFPTFGEVRGTGETSYVGGGALMRYRLDNVAKKLRGLALDASLRAGSQATDFASFDLRDANGTIADYELDSTYIAGHAGLSYTFQPSDKVATTIYARYLWTHIDNDDADICSDHVTFEDMSSNRLRFGMRSAWQVNAKWQPYAGLAYEWECSGTARAVTHGAGITAPSMRGGSVIGEIGAVWQPKTTRPLWLEFAAQGSAGKNTGYAGKVGVSIGF